MWYASKNPLGSSVLYGPNAQRLPEAIQLPAHTPAWSCDSGPIYLHKNIWPWSVHLVGSVTSPAALWIQPRAMETAYCTGWSGNIAGWRPKWVPPVSGSFEKSCLGEKKGVCLHWGYRKLMSLHTLANVVDAPVRRSRHINSSM